MYRLPFVSSSLDLTAEQFDQLNQLTAQVRERYSADYERVAALDTVPQLFAREALNQQYLRDWMNGASTLLTTDQFVRYQQIEMQRSGFTALADPAVQNWLNLAPQQRADLPAPLLATLQQRDDIRRLAASDPTAARQSFRDYRKQSEDLLNRFLTPDQIALWQQMTGTATDVEPTFTTPEP
jgi:hypothetical protein